MAGSFCTLLAAEGLPRRMVSPSTFTSKPFPPFAALVPSFTAVSTTLRSKAMGDPLTDIMTSPSFMLRRPGVSAVMFAGSNLGVAMGSCDRDARGVAATTWAELEEEEEEEVEEVEAEGGGAEDEEEEEHEADQEQEEEEVQAEEEEAEGEYEEHNQEEEEPESWHEEEGAHEEYDHSHHEPNAADY